MALPPLQRKLFRNDGYGPLLKPEIIPFTSDLASKDSSIAASTGWVKDLAAAPVYLDPAGSDSSDGMTAATAVQTFAKALEISRGLPHSRMEIIVAPGSYSGSINLEQDICVIKLNGAVSLAGNIQIEKQANVIIEANQEATASLSVSGFIYILDQSSLSTSVDITVDVSNIEGAIRVRRASNFLYTSNIVIYADGCTYGLLAHSNSNVVSTSDSSIQVKKHSNNCIAAFRSVLGSSIVLYSINIVNCTNSHVMSVYDHSAIFIGGLCNMEINSGEVCACSDSGYVECIDSLKKKFTGGSGSRCVMELISNSAFICGNTRDVELYLYTGPYVVNVAGGSCFSFSSGTLKISGTVTDETINVTQNSTAVISNSATVSGSVSGKRYNVNVNSVLSVVGAGANRIPGSVAGTTSNGGYYG